MGHDSLHAQGVSERNRPQEQPVSSVQRCGGNTQQPVSDDSVWMGTQVELNSRVYESEFNRTLVFDTFSATAAGDVLSVEGRLTVVAERGRKQACGSAAAQARRWADRNGGRCS